MWQIIFDALLPHIGVLVAGLGSALVAAIIGWFTPQPGKKGLQHTFIEKVGGIEKWQPIIQRLTKEFSEDVFTYVTVAVKDAMSLNKNVRHDAAAKQAMTNIMKDGQSISKSALNILIEVALDKLKSNGAKK